MNDLSHKDMMALDPWDDAFRGLMRPWRLGGEPGVPSLRIDVSEEPSAYVVKADLPGVQREHIDVRVDGNTVTIGAEVQREQSESKEGRVLRRERQVGYASRSFALASEVDESAADARYADGVLTLKLPKKAQPSKRRLDIR